MTPERMQRTYELFEQALQRPPEERSAFLVKACGEDANLRAEVSSLLEHDSQVTDDFLRPPEPEPTSAPLTVMERPDALIGSRVGGFHIKNVIASGGMGTVYEAVQERPHRTVALKIMKRNVASRSALRRFQFESQVLGHLRHPNIAQVYQAGMHNDGDDGVPYFAMEYVPGAKPVTGYADEKKLGTRDRLRLFAKACDAVHHGHQKGIIHRDLKPANILVDSAGEPKVIDFGVARATDSDLSITTQQTDIGQLVGTVQYMSPEQCDADPHDLDTRSDVYSLGVVLYELLTGKLPYEASSTTIYAATQAIKEQAPRRPSSINPRLRGDVETITLKALEKDRNRRYQSAADLAQDIRRHLKHEPVVAAPPSAAYRVRKFVRRNRGLAIGAALVVIVLVAGIAVSTWQALRATRAERLAGERLQHVEQARAIAEQRRAEAEEERAEAERQAAIAQAVRKLLSTDLIIDADPEKQRGLDLTFREVLNTASRLTEYKFKHAPLVEAALRATLGTTYDSFGEYELAEPHLADAFEIRLAELGPEHAETLSSMTSLGLLYHHQGRHREAERLYREELEIRIRELGEEHPDTPTAMNNLGALYDDLGRYDEAESLYGRALDIRKRVLGAEHPDTLVPMSNLAGMHATRGRYDEAERLYLNVLAVRRRVLGEEHPVTLDSMNNLAALYGNLGQYDKAEPLLTHVLKTRKRVLGEEHPATLVSMNNLAGQYWIRGQYREAERLYTAAVVDLRRALGEEHALTLSCMSNLAMLYHEQERYDEAEPLLVGALETSRRVLGEEHADTLSCMNDLAVLYDSQGRYADAEQLHLEALELRKRVLGEQHLDTLVSMNNLGESYIKVQRYSEAAQLLGAAVEGGRRSLPKGHWVTGVFLAKYGLSLKALGQRGEAEAALLEAHQILRNGLGADHEHTIKTTQSLIDLYDAWGKPGEAAAWRAKLPTPQPSEVPSDP